MTISIVIPTYKKVAQLLANVTHNLPFFKDCEIIVVNDDPHSSIEALRLLNANIRIVQNAKNLGFAGAVNVGIDSATGSHIFLLNNDVLLSDATFRNALAHFEKDPTLFAVGLAQTEKSGDTVGRNTIQWVDGFAQHAKAPDMQTGPSAWAEGGAALFDKAKLVKLGKFDTLYSPFYWEDTDLGYRAWKHGFTILFDASILVEHHHESTISSFFSQTKIKTIAYRNQLYFVWTNITDPALINEHIKKLPLWCARTLAKGDFSFVSALLQASLHWGQVQQSRAQKKALAIQSDIEVFAKTDLS